LSRELSLAIWERVGADATDSRGRSDTEQAERRFHDLAARIQARGGRLRPDVGRLTRVQTEILGVPRGAWPIDELALRAPGRTTLVIAEARRREATNTRSAEKLADAESLGNSVRDDGATKRHELPGVNEVAQAVSALQVSTWSNETALLKPPIRDGTYEPQRRDDRSPIAHEGQTRGTSAPISEVTTEGYPRAPLGRDADAFLGRLHSFEPATAPSAVPVLELLVARSREPGLGRLMQHPVVMRWADGPSPEGEAVEAALRPSGGEPLPPDLRAELEQQFGCDLSAVRLHRDGAAHSAARALHARAFTIGEHVFLLDAALDLSSPEGRALLAHELTHVVQHYQGRVALRPGFAVSRPDDPLEREAEAVGDAVARGAASPARSLMGSAIGTVGDGTASRGATSGGGDGQSSPSAPSLTGFRAPAPSSDAAHSGKLPGSPPPTNALIGQVAPVATTPVPRAAKPNRTARPQANAKATAKHDGRSPARAAPVAASPAAPAARKPAAGPPPAPPATRPQLHPVPAATEGGGATPAPQPVTGPRPSAAERAADRAAARQAAAAATRELAAHGAALAAQARAAGHQVLAQISAGGDHQRGRVTAAAQAARQQVEQGIAAQRAAILARAAAEKARATEAATAQRAAVQGAAQAQRQHTAEQVAAKRQAAQAAAQATKQGILQVGEAQAQRAAAQTGARVARARAIASSISAGGDAEAANAQRESAAKISQRAVEGVQSNGREMVAAAHDTAAALASEVDDKLADYNHNLDQCATDTNQHIAKLETDTLTELDTMARQAEQSITVLATEALSALDARKAAILASIEQSSAAATARLSHSMAAVQSQVSAQIEQQCGQLAAAGREAHVMFDHLEHADQVAAAQAQARAQLDQAGAGIGQAIQGVHTSTAAELTRTGETVASGLTDASTSGAAEVGGAGAMLLEKLTTVGGRAATSINERGGKARSTLVDSGQTLVQELAKAHGQFSDKLGGMIPLATRTISEKIDAGLAYQDEVIERAGGDAQRAAQQIGARYDSLKSEAESRNASGAQRSWLSNAWNAVTGWIDSVRQWFLRTFGDFWGGLLFGILSAIVIVAIGLAIGWVVGAIVGAIVATAEVAAIVTAIILLVGAAALAIYSRFQEFYADNPGQDAGWRAIGLVALGIADLTGIPFIVEGWVGQRAFGRELTDAESGERIGMGIVFLVTFGLAAWKGVKWFRGRSPRTTPPVEPPVDHPPVEPIDHPPPDPNRPDPNRPDPNPPDPNPPDPNPPDPNPPDPNRPDPNRPDPNRPDPNRPDPNRPDPNRPDPPVTDPWAEIVRKYNLAPDVVEQLRATNVDPAVADRMLARGVTSADIVRLSTTYGPEGVRAIDNLVRRGVQPRVAEDALRIANNLGIQGEVTDLVNSGNLENPASLRNFLQKIAGEVANGQRGAMNELLEVVNRARDGHRVSLGGRAFNPADPESGQADVVDHTAREAVQMKTVTSAAEDRVVSNLQSAVDQLGGSGGEVPPTGYQRTADVQITNPDNPLFNADRAAVQDALRGQINNLDNLNPADTPPGHVRITNGNPGSPFTFTADELR
jgi:hypothetical protein